MKYGLLVYKDTDNIGDDIQSYASKRFLPQIDYYVERENLENFLPIKKEEVAVIMNGWFMHNKQNFPPSDYIFPLLISMHFSIGDNWTLDKSLYLQKYSKDFLMKNGPVGSRDYVTDETLKKLGIDTYFSGCLTLTIPKFADVEKKDYICSVDLSEEQNDKLRNYYKDTDQEIIYTTHKIDNVKNARLSYEQRFRNVESLLKVYQASKGVITTRLHCALPCLALGIPVALIYNENSYDRLGTYADYLKIYSKDEYMNNDTKIEFYIDNEKVNELKKSLISKCIDFINIAKNKEENQNLLEVDKYIKQKRIDYINWKKDIMFIEINDVKKDLEYYKKALKNREDKIECLNNENLKLKDENEKLEKDIKNIQSSRSYKFLKRFKRI